MPEASILPGTSFYGSYRSFTGAGGYSRRENAMMDIRVEELNSRYFENVVRKICAPKKITVQPVGGRQNGNRE